MGVFESRVTFTFTPGTMGPEHVALTNLRALVIEAPTQAAADEYARWLLTALEQSANE